MLPQGTTGPSLTSDGAAPVGGLRMGKLGDQIISNLHGRYYEQVSRGNVYSIGCQLTALSAATMTLTASGQPIVGVWNPLTSGTNLILLQAALTDAINNVTSVALGCFIWCGSLSNASLTAGLNPVNRKTLAATGSVAKAFSLSTASLLTGLTNNVTFLEASEFPVASGLLTTTVAAATPTPSVSGVQLFDGSIIVPPGGVFGLFNTISVTTHSVNARLMWEEVPI